MSAYCLLFENEKMPAGTPFPLPCSPFSEPRCSYGVWEFGCRPRPEDVRAIVDFGGLLVSRLFG